MWINGEPQTNLPVSDRGLAYGDGVFETIRIASGQPTLVSLHWWRLKDSCRRLGIILDTPTLICEVDAFLKTQEVGDCILKVIITRGSGGRGYSPEGCQHTTRCLSLHPLPVRPVDPAFSGARVMSCKLRLGRSVLAGMKHLNRLEQVMARSEWQGSQWDEGIVSDFDEFLIEGTMSNLFIVTGDGRLLTPDLSHCGVAGVGREYILNKAKALGLRVEVGQYRLADLDIVEMFLCNSVNGVWPVVEFAGHCLDIGTETIRIRDCLLEELNA
ncbi:aminodeoxychorismate lyase [Endozoicomonas sp. (ex Bugula neritina AB1)]|nr:aminodeoxychorismate lyase [Endozoicomonas sp. (ex Bugula neritina AB1)]